MTITYHHLIESTTHTGHADCTEAEAIQAACEHLDASRSAGGYTYHADETGEDIEVSVEAMIAAGAAILGGAHDWYSLWCADHM